MKKLLLILMLAVVSSSTMAEWTKWDLVADWNDSPDMALYVGAATSHKGSNMVKMWYLWDFKFVHQAEGKKYLSVTSHEEYDCKRELSRTHAYLAFSGKVES